MTEVSIEFIQNRFAGPSWPEFIELSGEQNQVNLCLNIPASIRWFTGHFPEQPVLAGVVQTHWAIELGKACFTIQSGFHQISNLKFHSVVLPDTKLHLALRFNPENNSFSFNYQNAEHQFSEGKVAFH